MERLPVVEQAIGQLITEKQIRPIGVSRRRPADFELDVGQSDDTFLFERVSLLERIVMSIIRRVLSDGESWWTREQIAALVNASLQKFSAGEEALSPDSRAWQSYLPWFVERLETSLCG